MRLTDHVDLFGATDRVSKGPYGIAFSTSPLKLPSGRSRRHVLPSRRPILLLAVARAIMARVESTIRDWGCPLSQCYAGISAYPWSRLFDDHSLRLGLDCYEIFECGRSSVARYIEKHLLTIGADGGTGGGDENATFLYVYMKGPHTRE